MAHIVFSNFSFAPERSMVKQSQEPDGSTGELSDLVCKACMGGNRSWVFQLVENLGCYCYWHRRKGCFSPHCCLLYSLLSAAVRDWN